MPKDKRKHKREDRGKEYEKDLLEAIYETLEEIHETLEAILEAQKK